MSANVASASAGTGVTFYSTDVDWALTLNNVSVGATFRERFEVGITTTIAPTTAYAIKVSKDTFKLTGTKGGTDSNPGIGFTYTSLGSGQKKTGKVRDQYDLGDKIALITTDRQSAFDRVLASIPFKGQVLNLTSAWWFDKTKDIIPNHVIDIPDPNVTLAKKCDVFPIEFVIRGFITGSTSTSLWTVYNNGDREYCGNALPLSLIHI